MNPEVQSPKTGTSKKRNGEVSRESNRLTIRDFEAKKSYLLNLEDLKTSNPEFVKDVEEKPSKIKRNQKITSTFAVTFELNERNQLIPGSLKYVPEERASLATVLKNVSEKRKTEVELSPSTDLKDASEHCRPAAAAAAAAAAASSPLVPPRVPPGSRRITVDDIINQANEGIEARIEELKARKPEAGTLTCPACGDPEHSKSEPISFNTWYYLDESDGKGGLSVRANHRFKELQGVLEAEPFCQCNLKAIPRSPCNVFRRIQPLERVAIDNAYEGKYAAKLRDAVFPGMRDRVLSEIAKRAAEGKAGEPPIPVMFPVSRAIKDDQRINHIVPRSAGGCPTKTLDLFAEYESKTEPEKKKELKPSNLIPIWNMCPLCQLLDELFTKWQSEQQHATIDSFITNVIKKQPK